MPPLTFISNTRHVLPLPAAGAVYALSRPVLLYTSTRVGLAAMPAPPIGVWSLKLKAENRYIPSWTVAIVVVSGPFPSVSSRSSVAPPALRLL